MSRVHEWDITQQSYSDSADVTSWVDQVGTLDLSQITFNSIAQSLPTYDAAEDAVSFDGSSIIGAGSSLTDLAALATGTHDGSANAATLSDSGASFTTDEFVGMEVLNITDGSHGTITANSTSTITATLSGGTDNDWDASDVYAVSNGYTVLVLCKRASVATGSSMLVGCGRSSSSTPYFGLRDTDIGPANRTFIRDDSSGADEFNGGSLSTGAYVVCHMRVDYAANLYYVGSEGTEASNTITADLLTNTTLDQLTVGCVRRTVGPGLTEYWTGFIRKIWAYNSSESNLTSLITEMKAPSGLIRPPNPMKIHLLN